MAARRTVLLALTAAMAHADNINKPHYHAGVFRRYKPGPPKSAGLKLSAAEERRLKDSHKAEGKVIMLPETASSPKGTIRCISVQDIKAPPNVVWQLLLDFSPSPGS